MADRTDPARPRRARRFVMPDEDGDRADRMIEAFLRGPGARPMPAARPVHSVGASRRPPLDSRHDWDAALQIEASRAARYRRPATVVAIDVTAGNPGGPRRDVPDRLAAEVGRLLRREARDSDRVTRFGPTRFRILLPETTEAEARRFVERVRMRCEVADGAGDLRLRSAVAASGPGRSLLDALTIAESRLAS